MRVLLVGVGGVGEAIAAIAKPRAWMELMVLADYNVKRAEEVQQKLGDEGDQINSLLNPLTQANRKILKRLQRNTTLT